MQRSTSTNRSIGDQILASRLQDFNLELDRIYVELSNENISTTYNVNNQLTQVVDNENSITVQLDWSDWQDPTTPKIYIQEVWDPMLYTILYTAPGGPIASIVYA